MNFLREGQSGLAAASPDWRKFTVTCLLLAWSSCVPVRAAPALNDAAPALVLSELGGQSFDLGELRGKVVLVRMQQWSRPRSRQGAVVAQRQGRRNGRGQLGSRAPVGTWCAGLGLGPLRWRDHRRRAEWPWRHDAANRSLRGRVSQQQAEWRRNRHQPARCIQGQMEGRMSRRWKANNHLCRSIVVMPLSWKSFETGNIAMRNPTIAAIAALLAILAPSLTPALAASPQDEKGKTCRMEQQCRWENFKKICTYVKVCR